MGSPVGGHILAELENDTEKFCRGTQARDGTEEGGELSGCFAQ